MNVCSSAGGRSDPSVRACLILPAFNRASALLETLFGVARQTSSPDSYEVIVVDDGSSDDLLEVAAGCFLPCRRQLLTQAHGGPAASRNLGARSTAAQLLIFLDSDMVPCDELVAAYLAAHQQNPRSIILGRQLPWPDAFTTSFDRAFNYVSMSDIGPQELIPPWYYLASGNFAIPRYVFEELQGFDERLLMTEDTDLAFRAYQAGINFRYCPAAIGYHNHPKTLSQLCRAFEASAYWTARLMSKHPVLAGQLPLYREVQPLRLGRDSRSLTIRKLVWRMVALRACLAAIRAVPWVLDHAGAPQSALAFWYWKLLGGYRLRGFRSGLRFALTWPDSSRIPASPSQGAAHA